MKYPVAICALLLLLLAGSKYPAPVRVYEIPARQIDPFALAGDSAGQKQQVPAFLVSGLVTFGEYRTYLDAVKKDSTELFYLSQLPDSSIAPDHIRRAYITDAAYDDFPVLGISWENAMNFCRWKTFRENKDSIRFIYRLPTCLEWLDAYDYLSENKLKHDFNRNYSDWLLNAKTSYLAAFRRPSFSFVYDYVYFHQKKDPPVLKRKFVIGDSYRYQQEKILAHYRFSYYANEGYPHVAFRYVKEWAHRTGTGRSIFDQTLTYWRAAQ